MASCQVNTGVGSYRPGCLSSGGEGAGAKAFWLNCRVGGGQYWYNGYTNTVMSIAPLPPLSTRVDACTDRLRGAILDGTFPPGSRLPAERALAEALDVTRITLRGALARLTARGLISAHQGRGTTVRDFLHRGGPDLIGDLMALAPKRGMRHAIARDLLAVRRALAGVVLERLVEAQPDPGPILVAIEAFTQAAASGADPEVLAEADVAILRALLAATESPVLQLCLNPILQVLRGSPQLRGAIYRTPADNADGWAALAIWIQAPDRSVLPALMDLLADTDAETCRVLTEEGA